MDNFRSLKKSPSWKRAFQKPTIWLIILRGGVLEAQDEPQGTLPNLQSNPWWNTDSDRYELLDTRDETLSDDGEFNRVRSSDRVFNSDVHRIRILPGEREDSKEEDEKESADEAPREQLTQDEAEQLLEVFLTAFTKDNNDETENVGVSKV